MDEPLDPQVHEGAELTVSKRPPSFTVTAAGGTLALDAAGEANASFTVTNTSSQAVTGRLLTKPSDPAKQSYLMCSGSQ